MSERKITSIDELAATMFEVHAMAEPLGNPEFCCSLVSCAVTIAKRDGLDDEAVIKMVLDTTTTALAVQRAQRELMAHPLRHGKPN